MRFSLATLLLVFTSSCYFIGASPAKRLQKSATHQPFDAAIVPGLPFKNGKWDTLLKTRILWAVHLYKKGIVRNIIFSGNAVYTPYKEAKAMAIYARALGVDSAHIFTDTIAEHSTENVFYSYNIAKQLGYKKLALATDPFQCYMLNKYCKKKYKDEIYLLPVVYDSIASMTHQEPGVDTKPAFVNNFIPISEKQTTRQRIKASRGKNISTN